MSDQMGLDSPVGRENEFVPNSHQCVIVVDAVGHQRDRCERQGKFNPVENSSLPYFGHTVHHMIHDVTFRNDRRRNTVSRRRSYSNI